MSRIVPLYENQERKKELDIWEFIGKLEWLKDAELENMKPFDITKLRTPHRLFILVQGIKYAFSLHSVILLSGLLIVLFSFFIPIIFYFSFLIEVLLIMVKVGFPIWMIRKFVIWEKSLMTKIIEDFITGYVFTSFVLDILSAIFSVFAYVFFNVLGVYGELKYIASAGLKFFNLKSSTLWLVNCIFDFIPLIYFYRYKKQKRFKVPRWTVLDEVPEA